MHYSRDAFTHDGSPGSDTIQAKDPTIPVGDAHELSTSPLDNAKTNALYNCGELSYYYVTMSHK